MFKKFQDLQNYLYRAAAVQLTGIQLPTVWGPLDRVGNTWLGGVVVQNGKKMYRGSASDSSRRILPIRALMEALETMAIYRTGLDLQSRTGLAAAFSEKEARDRAYQELIERDALLYHWLGEVPGQAAESNLLSRFKKKLADGVEETQNLLAVRLWSADPEVHVYLAGAKSSYGCWALGMGAAVNKSDALKKSLFELLAKVAVHRAENACYAKVLRDEDESSRRFELAAHHLSTKEPEISSLLEHVLGGTRNANGATHHSADPSRLRAKTQYRALQVEAKNYFVVQSSNPDLMPLYFGKRFHEYRHHYLANPRLSQALSGSQYRFHSLERHLPHPID